MSPSKGKSNYVYVLSCRSFFIIRPDTDQREKCRSRRMVLVFLEKDYLLKKRGSVLKCNFRIFAGTPAHVERLALLSAAGWWRKMESSLQNVREERHFSSVFLSTCSIGYCLLINSIKILTWSIQLNIISVIWHILNKSTFFICFLSVISQRMCCIILITCKHKWNS